MAGFFACYGRARQPFQFPSPQAVLRSHSGSIRIIRFRKLHASPAANHQAGAHQDQPRCRRDQCDEAEAQAQRSRAREAGHDGEA
jgi:hypothetical protein